ncbi:MAG: winged helix-turn-helix domain-containing protein [Rhizobiaceae bacterium]|nr:winged helix-turn-helix domain-containing protein [Rhizobiaceae bacterium]
MSLAPSNCPCCGQMLPPDDSLRVDEAGIVVRNGRFAVLTKQESEIFALLRAARGKIVTREQLLTGLYPIDADEAEIKIIDVFVCKLRAKLKPLDVTVQTVWGRGYRFVPTFSEGSSQ